MKKLSIIIPYHNEDENLLSELLESIDSQENVNWDDIEMIISNDSVCPKDLSEVFKFFPRVNKILKYLECPIHIGPGPNRQYAMDNASGEFLMMADSDDFLYNSTSLRDILDKLDNSYDLYVSPEYQINNENYLCIVDEGNLFLHSKIIKKEFLSRIGLKFLSDVRIFEDTYFVKAMLMSNPKINNSIGAYYVYRHNNESITNHPKSEAEKLQNIRDYVVITIKLFEFLQKSNHVNDSVIKRAYINLLKDRYKRVVDVPGEKICLEHQVNYMINKLDPKHIICKAVQVKVHGKESYLRWIDRVIKEYDSKKIECDYKLSAANLNSLY